MFVKPMLASALPEGDKIDNYDPVTHVMQQKYDGHRRIVVVSEGGQAQWWSRAGNSNPIPSHIAAQLALLAPGTYDGEAIILGGACTDVKADAAQGRMQLVLFDLLKVGDLDAKREPYTSRRALLEVAFQHVEDNAALRIAEEFPPSAATLDAMLAMGLEGAIIKRKASTYQSGGRSRDWVKFKKLGAAQITITGFVAGKLGPYSTIRGVDARGVEVTVKTLNTQWRNDIAKNPAGFVGRTLVISFQEQTKDGAYWHPRADHWL